MVLRPQSTSPHAGPTLLEQVKVLRKETNAGVADCREALVLAQGNMDQAKRILSDKAKKVPPSPSPSPPPSLPPPAGCSQEVHPASC